MLRLTSLALLTLLASCAASSEPASDFISAKAFLEQCTETNGWNFTYKETVGSVLERALVAPFDPALVPDREFEARLDSALAGSGLDATPLGGPDSRTLVIDRGV